MQIRLPSTTLNRTQTYFLSLLSCSQSFLAFFSPSIASTLEQLATAQTLCSWFPRLDIYYPATTPIENLALSSNLLVNCEEGVKDVWLAGCSLWQETRVNSFFRLYSSVVLWLCSFWRTYSVYGILGEQTELAERKTLGGLEKSKAGSQTQHTALLHHLKRIFFPLVTPKNTD